MDIEVLTIEMFPKHDDTPKMDCYKTKNTKLIFEGKMEKSNITILVDIDDTIYDLLFA